MEQLALDLEAAMSSEDDLLARIRASVSEDGMTVAEIDAAVQDALQQVGVTTSTRMRVVKPAPCICDHPLLFAAELGSGRCGLCGRGATTVTTISTFAKAAERSGAEEVYRVARVQLDDRDLGRLLLHLRRVDPNWRPQLKECRRLAARLLEAGVPDREVIEHTGISRTTVWRIRRDLASPPNGDRRAALQSGADVSNGPSPTRRSSGAPLAFSASSGNGDDRALRLLLGGGKPRP